MSFNASKYLDFKSLIHSQKIIDSAYNVNTPITGKSLTQLSKNIIMSSGSDTTFTDLGILEDNTGGWNNYIQSKRLDIQGGHVRDNLIGVAGQGVITVAGDETMIKVVGYKGSSNFSYTQQQQSKLEGWNILTKLISAHSMKYFETIDKLSYDRLVNAGYDKKESDTKWDDMTADEKYQWIYDLLNDQRAGRKRAYWANVLALDDRAYNDVTTIDYSSTKEGTIAEKLQKVFNIKFVSSWRLYELGTDKTRAMVAFNNSSYNILNRIPIKLMLSPMSKRGFTSEFESIFRVAGVDLLDLGGGIVGDKL